MDNEALITARIRYIDAANAIEQAAPGWPDVEQVVDLDLLQAALERRHGAETEMLDAFGT